MRTSRAASLPAGAQHAVPPHDRAGHEHRRGGQPEYRPNRLRRLVAEPWAATRNSYAVNAAEMQVGEPINNLVADACPGISGSERLESVGEVLKRLGNAEIDPAYGKHQRESKAPETDHAVHVPGQALPSHAAMQCQAATPGPDARPPDHQSRGSKREQGECANAV